MEKMLVTHLINENINKSFVNNSQIILFLLSNISQNEKFLLPFKP